GPERCHDPDVRCQKILEKRAGARAPPPDPRELGEDPVESPVVNGEENLFLVPKVVVEAPLRHEEPIADLLHRGSVVAVPAKGPDRALEDRVDPIPASLRALGHDAFSPLNARSYFDRLFKFLLDSADA